MRIPTSWNDKSLLQDEPFLKGFRPVVKGITTSKDAKLITDITQEMLKTIGIPALTKIIDSWLNYALVCAPGTRIQGRKTTRPQPTESPAMRLFIEFFLHLYRDDLDKALSILNRQRGSWGLGPFDPNWPIGRPKAKSHLQEKIPRPTSQHPTRHLLKSNDKQKTKNTVMDNISPASSVERSGPQTSKSGKNRSRSVPPPSQQCKRPANEHLERPTKKRVVAADHALPRKDPVVGKVSRDEGTTVPVEPSSSSARDLRRSTQYPKSTEEQKGFQPRDKQTKYEKLKVPQGLKIKRILPENIKANNNDNNKDATLQVKQELLTNVSGDSKALPPHQLPPPDPQLSRKRPATRAIDQETKRRKVAARTIDNSPTVPTREDNKNMRKKRRKDSTNKPEDKAANTLNPVQSVKAEDLTQPSELSILLPLDENCRRDILHNRLFLPSHRIHVSIHGKEIDFRTSIPPSFPTPPSIPAPLELQVPSPTFDSTKATTPIVSEPDDIANTVLPSALSVKNESDFPLSTLQFPPEASLTIVHKAPLPNLPPIWAQSRQEVCESFDWFRSYQGGVYHTHEITKGYLLSGFPSSRDRFEHGGRLIISHGIWGRGGRSESMHSTKGHISCQPASDQLAHDKSVRALINNYKNNRPLALLVDDKYALFPFDLRSKDVTYAVLGFYIVENVWAEYQPANNESGRVVRYKFAFRWCEDQGPPWWISMVASEESPAQPLTKIGDSSESLCALEISTGDKLDEREVSSISSESGICLNCQKQSPRVFNACWVCLTPDCRMFWRQAAEGPSFGHVLSGDLSYHPKFLGLPPYKPLPYGFREIVTSLPRTGLTNSSRIYHFTRGFHCAKCGRLSCRSQWEKWQCLNCGESLIIHEIPRQACDIWNQKLPVSFKDYLLNPISDIVVISPATFIHDSGRGTINSFILPRRRLVFIFDAGNFNGRKEADLLFLEYQRQATTGTLKFRRWPMRAHKCRGSLLTNYFSNNAGEPYKYVGGDANTVPFSSAPAACQARGLIQKRIKEALGMSAEFNEVLSVAYMERQKMAFHSDDEIGLGPLVAGLSLGSPALMHFRLHGLHDPEREKRGILLSIVLRHGDVLVMDGAGIQEYYEHTVVPNNFRIAATARQISSTHQI